MIVQEIVESMSLQNLATLLSIDTSEIDTIDLDDMGIEVETPSGFQRISSYVVKQSTIGYKLGDLTASSVHRVLHDGVWKFVSEVPGVVKTNDLITVVDIEVPDGDCYIANGWVNHNTTPGGWISLAS